MCVCGGGGGGERSIGKKRGLRNGEELMTQHCCSGGPV
jgi:hypothetical protein